MSYGSGSSSRRWDIQDKEGVRVVYGDCGCPTQIRSFRADAKLGDPVDAWDLIYDDCYNLINIQKTAQAEHVDNLDIRVPEQPVITGSTPPSPNASKTPTINGTVGIGTTGEVVKDGDTIEIKDVNTGNVVGSGIVSSNSFNVSIDLSSYDAGEVELSAIAYNDRKKRNGGSKLSIEFIYEII